MSISTNGYDRSYSDDSFWAKCRGALALAGAEVLRVALQLFYAMKRPETPLWAKTAILGSLGYFISPIDVIPDVIPVLGFTDDLAVLTAAAATVAHYIDDETRQLADQKLRDWGLA